MSPAKFMFTESSDSLGRLGWGLGSTVTYEYQPFEVGKNGVYLGSAVNNLILQHIYGDLGITDWFTVGFDMPLAWSYQYRDLINDPGASASRRTAAGDLMLRVKVPVLDRAKDGVGLAFQSWATFPTGKSSDFLGAGSMSAAGVLILDGSPAPWVTLGINLGYIVQDRTEIAGVLDSDDQFLCKLAAAFDIGKGVGLVSEVNILTETKHFFASKDVTPITARQGIRWDIDEHWRLEAGGEFGLIHGVGAPRAGAYMGFRYIASKARTLGDEPAARTASARPAIYVPPAGPSPVAGTISSPAEAEQEVRHATPEGWGRIYATSEGTIAFPAGSSSLTQQAQDQLCDAAGAATADRSVTSVRIEGYAANEMTESDLRGLSTDRAIAAARHFKSCAGRNIEVFLMGLGSNYPTGQGTDHDRRVEIIFIHQR